MFYTGQNIGPYELVQTIGKGAFGQVWLAERKGFVTTQVAIKLPISEQIELEAVRQEAQLWASISGHANVLPIIEANIYDGQVVIVSEFVKDGSLRRLLETNAFPDIKQRVQIVIGLLSGLEHLHQHRIIHRDLKPENVLIQNGTPRLADFGISRTIRATSSHSMNVTGTPSYMAPEAFDGKRNQQTDLWSIGVILYEMLSGTLPFPQKEITGLIGAIVLAEPNPLPSDVPKALAKIVEQSLQKSTVRRFADASSMKIELEEFLVSYHKQNLTRPSSNYSTPQTNTSLTVDSPKRKGPSLPRDMYGKPDREPRFPPNEPRVRREVVLKPESPIGEVNGNQGLSLLTKLQDKKWLFAVISILVTAPFLVLLGVQSKSTLLGIVPIVGTVIYLIGIIWLLIIAIKNGQSTGEKVGWGFAIFLCSPIGSLVYCIVNRHGGFPLLLQITGFVLSMLGGSMNPSGLNMR